MGLGRRVREGRRVWGGGLGEGDGLGETTDALCRV